ncbi:hypothetical protein Nepgr_006507 [Nepenthes gracilis]|uniref:Uncharacterized protein n=1 Tax=Nepenthes gracilis TaxID=150966 RepID=A0AAD3S5X4_NEPGR|nr:hypothetical protein Nepgr_006507 [Nepenthes gracilis]
MAPSITQIDSVIKAGEVRELYIEYNIHKLIVFKMSSKGDRVCSPPEGCITIYDTHLKSGLRLPVSDELLDILTALQIPIAQFYANAKLGQGAQHLHWDAHQQEDCFSGATSEPGGGSPSGVLTR